MQVHLNRRNGREGLRAAEREGARARGRGARWREGKWEGGRAGGQAGENFTVYSRRCFIKL